MPESGFHVNVTDSTCYLMDLPHSDPTGCPNCPGTTQRECPYWKTASKDEEKDD